jgi:hypothetical protein
MPTQFNNKQTVDSTLYNVRCGCYDGKHMNKQDLIKQLLKEKRKELIWALSLQGFTHEDITEILRPVDRSNVTRIISQMPEGWESKWVKRG